MQQVGRIAAEVAHDFNKEALTVRKFKDRATAVSRIWKQIQTLEAPAPEPVRKPRQATGKKAAGLRLFKVREPQDRLWRVPFYRFCPTCHTGGPHCRVAQYGV